MYDDDNEKYILFFGETGGLYNNKDLNTYYLNGREDCLNEIDAICDELEAL